jgi:hypothetical protein
MIIMLISNAGLIVALSVALCGGRVFANVGPVAQWNFDEGKGAVAHDSAGKGNEGEIHGAQWVKLPKGYALKFDGNGYVDCGQGHSLDIAGPMSLEAWIHPVITPSSEVGVMGKSFGSYLLTYYSDNCCWCYIANGANKCKAQVDVGGWHHVVATFDGKRMAIYADGLLAEDAESRFAAPGRGKKFFIGSAEADQPEGPASCFNGMIAAVRVYDRALRGDEITQHYKGEAERYGIDTAWLGRIRSTLYPYFDRSELVVGLDYRGLRPVAKDARIKVELLPVTGQEIRVLNSKEISPLPEWGEAEATLSVAGLQPGEYEVKATLFEEKGERTSERTRFSYLVPPVVVPPPEMRVAPALPKPAGPPKYEFEQCAGGGFQIKMNNAVYPFESSYSYPQGGENKLTASAQPQAKGEATWEVKTRKLSDGEFSVVARGKFYTIERRIQVQPSRVYVTDTIRNDADEDIGILIHNQLNSKDKKFEDYYLAGYKQMGRKEETGSPSVFVSAKDCGLGIVPLDDVLIVQSVLSAEPDSVGVGTEAFALAKGASYALEWAVYPVATGDYYDFINAVRRDEDRNSVIDGGFAFTSNGPFDRRNIPTEEFITLRNIKYGCIHGLSGTADDPQVSVEGIEFVNFPKEMELLKKQMAAIHARFPGLKMIFHIAHSLYLSNHPDIFPDSKVILADGSQAIWDDPAATYITKERQAAGWKWRIYYPTPGNSFHDALIKSTDVIMDEIGSNGVFMDGFMWGYCGRYTYDRWDGHSAEIDKNTKTIRRKKGSVLLLSQPSTIAFARKIRDKGGVVVANNSVITRTMAKEKYIIYEHEVFAGPYLDLGPTCAALANPASIGDRGDTFVCRDVLRKLKWGSLFFYYEEGAITHESLPAQMYPLSFEEIHSGYVKGKERLVTMHSGVYGWAGDKDLHLQYHYDGRGVPIPPEFLTTVDSDGVRTEISLKKDESAVLKRIPITVSTKSAVNLFAQQYDGEAIQLNFNGKAKIDLVVKDGDFSIRPGAIYRVKGAGVEEVAADETGTLSLPLTLDGQSLVRITQKR